MPNVKKLGKYLNANQSYSRLFSFSQAFFPKKLQKKLIPHTRVEDKHKQAFALFSLIHKLLSVLDTDATIGARDALAL